jgi:hypothetical protein
MCRTLAGISYVACKSVRLDMCAIVVGSYDCSVWYEQVAEAEHQAGSHCVGSVVIALRRRGQAAVDVL